MIPFGGNPTHGDLKAPIFLGMQSRIVGTYQQLIVFQDRLLERVVKLELDTQAMDVLSSRVGHRELHICELFAQEVFRLRKLDLREVKVGRVRLLRRAKGKLHVLGGTLWRTRMARHQDSDPRDDQTDHKSCGKRCGKSAAVLATVD